MGFASAAGGSTLGGQSVRGDCRVNSAPPNEFACGTRFPSVPSPHFSVAYFRRDVWSNWVCSPKVYHRAAFSAPSAYAAPARLPCTLRGKPACRGSCFRRRPHASRRSCASTLATLARLVLSCAKRQGANFSRELVLYESPESPRTNRWRPARVSLSASKLMTKPQIILDV